MFYDEKALKHRFKEIVDTAIAEYEPSKVFLSYSGGSDSAVVLHLSELCGYNFDVYTIDTGVSSQAHLQNIVELCQKLDKKLWIYSGAGLDWYIKNVREYGFGYTPSAHSVYYRSLKERAIRTTIRDFKTHHHDRIMFLTGVRRLESIKRRDTPLIRRSGSRVTVNPIAEFDDRDKGLFIPSWWSGEQTIDCMCNWHCKYTLADIDNPYLQQEIEKISGEHKNIGLWGYGEKPTNVLGVPAHDNEKEHELPLDSWCISCINKK